MPIRRLLVLCLLVLTLVPVAEGQRRRRAVRSGPALVTPGQCHTFGLVKAGLKATYLTNAQGGDVNFTITYISDAPTETRTTQTVTTAQGNAEAETVVTGEIVGNLRAIKHVFVRTVSIVPVIGRFTTDVDIDFVPSLAAGPAAGWCVGNTWQTAPSVQTIMTRPSIGPPTTITNNLIGSEGIVLAVDDVIQVPAGEFHTVKYRGAIVAGTGVSTAITWVSKEHNIVVRQDTVDAGGSVTSVTRLMELSGG
ncbi:MAG TPA: hypothetical protein VE974_22100 [Thermoanaerobaculia bacterium]|nr:hypothetical protein [Thermoanaerobaculia bacterium]